MQSSVTQCIFFFVKSVIVVLQVLNRPKKMDSIVFDRLFYHHCFQVCFCFTLCFIFGLYSFFCLFVVMFFPDVCAGCKDSVELKREGRESRSPQGENEHWEGCVCVCACTCMSFQQKMVLVLP